MASNYYEDKIKVKDIIQNDQFRISRNFISSELVASMKNSGMLEKPFLLKIDNYYYPLTCHNRIRIIRDLDIPEVEVYMLNSPSYEVFIRNLQMKIYRNECGPIGRIRAFNILRDIFGIEQTQLADFARKTLKIPNDIFTDEAIIDCIIKLPEAINDYIDLKDISFKLIRDIVKFDEALIAEVNRWIEKVQIRLNIFKMLVDFLFDIRKRDGLFNAINDDVLLRMDDKALYDFVFKIRYPEYALKKEKADKIVSRLNRHGVYVDYPEYFEKDSISLKLIINKKETGSKIVDITSGLDLQKIDELLSML